MTRWPAEMTVGYLANRAGMSRHQVRRLIKSIPSLASLMHEGRWTRIKLQDLKAAAPDFFESIRLGEEIASNDDEE